MKVKSRKTALVLSSLSLLLCFAMLIGSTFAWFTDTASTGVNKIVSGNLDVDIVDKNDISLEGKTLQFRDVNGETDILWEPGATFNLDSFKIVNKGNLALKYKVTINGLTGDAGLLKVIKFSVQKDGVDAGELEDWEGVLLPTGKTATEGTNEEVGQTKLITISAHMDESAGNEYMAKTLSGISITVTATQYTYENDSEGNTYDEKAEYPEVAADDLKTALADLPDGAVVSVTGTLTEALEITKPVTLHNLTATAPITINSSGVTLNAANITSTEASKPAITVDKDVEDVTITNSYISADTTKEGNHTAVSIPVSAKVVFRGNTVTNTYNGVEFGLNVPVADGTVIEDNNFVNMGNNAISIYQVADGGAVTIRNNVFSGTADKYIPIRLSNSNNATATFNITDNTADTDSAWENCFVLLQDYTSNKTPSVQQDFTKYTLDFTGNTVGSKCTYTVVWQDGTGIIDTNQPNVNKVTVIG